ncbi:hypothetical protein CN934_32935 [Ensifer sp. MMN_5]|nr:hypothetical protein CN934_32935 [Ensifer sp. MMN_5]
MIWQARRSERSSDARRLHAWRQTVTLKKLAEYGGTQHLLGQHLLQLGISSSSAFRRFASETSMPPCLTFQL